MSLRRPSLIKANYELYRKSTALTEYKEYPDRTHFTLGQAGWEQVADDVPAWAAAHAHDEMAATAWTDRIGSRLLPRRRASAWRLIYSRGRYEYIDRMKGIR